MTEAPALALRTQATRLQFIDNIRWALIVLVIAHHAAVTYSHVGSWYYSEDPRPALVPTLLFATFLSFNQAYFMGFLFFIAGYFTPSAFDRKGFSAFTRDRFRRLGVPTLIFMLVIHPVIVYWLLRDFYQPSRPSFDRCLSAIPRKRTSAERFRADVVCARAPDLLPGLCTVSGCSPADVASAWD